MKEKTIEYDVIVIGAGISGLRCSQLLKEKGISTIILEARDRIGGRLHSPLLNGHNVDLGASFIHGACEINPVYNYCISNKLSLNQREGNQNIQKYDDGEELSKVISREKTSMIGKNFNSTIKKVQNSIYF